MTGNNTAWLSRRLQVLDRPRPVAWPDLAELRRRGRRRAARHRVAVSVITVTAVAAAVAIPLHLLGPGGNGGPQANAGFRVIARSGVAAELAAATVASPTAAGPGQPRGLAHAETGFALALLRDEAGAHPGTDQAVSPGSLAIALSMLELGARGPTEQQIAAALGTAGLTPLQQAAAWHALTASESRAAQRAGIDLESANGLWAQYGLPLRRPFMSALRGNFGAGVWQADFAHHWQAVREAINAWVSGHTHGRIPELLSPSAVTAKTKAVLADAAYLKAPWAMPFDRASTATGRFHSGAGAAVTVPFMHFAQAQRLAATTGHGVDAVQLPYRGGRFAALVVMPTTGTLDGYLHSLTPASLGRVVRGLHETNVSLSLPRFQVRSGGSLNSTLQAMGIRDAFLNADLTAMTPVPLDVGEVVQRVFLRVNEQGTEAAAATGITMIPVDVIGTQLTLTIDHPFLFLVRDTTTGAILFAAAVSNPAA